MADYTEDPLTNTLTMTPDDHHFMTVALELAEKGLGTVAPNPSVGCVIVRDNRIIGSGYTSPGGRPHGEVNALRNASEPVAGATMYVTLEPCCHQGVTGPCTSAVIDAGIKRVVIATTDPNEKVSGKGVKLLEEAGLEVTCGLLQQLADQQNIGFFYTKLYQRPYIACKVATTLDGKIAASSYHSKWITSEQTRTWVHQLRATYDSIMIGSNTLVQDDPTLTCRLVPGQLDRSPVRLIVDSGGRLTRAHRIAKTAQQFKTWVISTNEVEDRIPYVEYLLVKPNSEGKVCVEDLVQKLALTVRTTRVMLEGGGELITQFMKLNLIDRLIICRSGKILGNDGIPFVGALGLRDITECIKFKKHKIIEMDEDVVEIWDAVQPKC